MFLSSEFSIICEFGKLFFDPSTDSHIKHNICGCVSAVLLHL
jgi:hypothetical protein